MRQLLYQVFYTRHKVSFYLWWIGPVIKHKVPKNQDCRCEHLSQLCQPHPSFISSSFDLDFLKICFGFSETLKYRYHREQKMFDIGRGLWTQFCLLSCQIFLITAFFLIASRNWGSIVFHITWTIQSQLVLMWWSGYLNFKIFDDEML